MRRITLVVGTVSLLGLGTIGAIACGGDEASDVLAAPPDAAAESATSTSSSGGTSGSTSSSSGSSGEGGASSSSSGELPSNPGQLTCGAVTCDAGANGPGPGPGGFNSSACCQSAAEADTKCQRANDCDNEGANGKLLLRCDETADCTNNNDICCYTKSTNGGGDPSFTASCGSRQFQCRTGFGGDSKLRPQLCKTSAECGDAGACNLKTCDGFKLHVCGSPDGCQ